MFLCFYQEESFKTTFISYHTDFSKEQINNFYFSQKYADKENGKWNENEEFNVLLMFLQHQKIGSHRIIKKKYIIWEQK